MSIEIKQTEPIYSISKGQHGWKVRHELYVADRASISISADCPQRYKEIIIQCIEHGWIEPIANFNSKERTLLGLVQ